MHISLVPTARLSLLIVPIAGFFSRDRDIGPAFLDHSVDGHCISRLAFEHTIRQGVQDKVKLSLKPEVYDRISTTRVCICDNMRLQSPGRTSCDDVTISAPFFAKITLLYPQLDTMR